MREVLQSALGMYSPSFFKMHINVREHLGNIHNLSVETSAAFVHEYVHFLQDITTIYGQKNIISVVDYIKTVNYNQRQSGETNLKIPYIPQEGRDGGAYYNTELQKLHLGTLSMNYSGLISGIEVQIVQQNVGYEVKNIETIVLALPNTLQTYKFGSHAIIESMAFGIEQSLYPDVLEAPDDFCYIAGVEVVRFVYPALLGDSKNIIALYDASLMYYNPGAVFYRTLELMNHLSYLPVTAYDIYSFVYSHFEMQFHMMSNVVEIFNNHTLTAISQLEGYFTTELFAANRKWMNEMLTQANGVRTGSWGFFVDLASGGPLNQNPTFLNLFGRLGMPLVTNQDSIAFFASPINETNNVRPDLMWVINQVYNIYINTNASAIRRCAMIEWCRASCRNQDVEDYTDYRCFESPWERSRDNQLCVFAQVWKTWGMEQIVPRNRQ